MLSDEAETSSLDVNQLFVAGVRQALKRELVSETPTNPEWPGHWYGGRYDSESNLGLAFHSIKLGSLASFPSLGPGNHSNISLVWGVDFQVPIPPPLGPTQGC